MATKTISLDMEAYDRLKGAQRENESFSQTIKRVIGKPIDFDKWLASIERQPLGEDAIAAVEKVVAGRRAKRNRRP